MPLSQQDIQKFKDSLSKVAKSRVSEALEVIGKAQDLLAQPELQKDPEQENCTKVEELLAALETNVTFLEGHGSQLQTTIGKLEEIRKEVATVQEFKEKTRVTYKPGHPEWKRLDAEIKAAAFCSGLLDGVLTEAKSCNARETDLVAKRKTFKAEAAKIKAARDTVIRNLEENKIGTFIQNYCNFSNLVKDHYTELFFNELMEAQSKLLDKIFEDEGKWKKVEDGIKDRLKHFYPPDKDVFLKGDEAQPETPATPATVSVPALPPTPPPPPPVPAKAQLQVRIEPAGFALQINGKDYGAAPCEVSLEAGAYTVRASLAGYPVQERQIVLTPGQVAVMDFGKIEPDAVKVEVISTPTGAAITLDGQVVPQATNATLNLKPGREYTVRVIPPNCQPMEKRVQVQIGRAERLEFTGFEAVPTRIRLQMEPAEAAVELNGRTLYMPLPEFLPVKTGVRSSLKVSLAGYQSQVREFTAQPGQEETLTFKLEKIAAVPESKPVEAAVPKPPPIPPLPGPKPSLLTITSTPPGAEIWLNGQRFQNAANQPVLTPNTSAPLALESGHKQIVELRLAGHKPHRKEIEALPGAAISTHIVMEKDAPRQATLIITSAPPGATIILNGKPIGQTSGNDLKVEPGNYKLEIAYKGYKPQQKQVQLKEGQAFRDHFNLEVLIETADVAFSSTPYEAEVRVDGKVMGKTNLTLKLVAGKRAIEIALPGYKPVKQELQVQKDQPLQLDFELEPIAPPAVVAPPPLAPSGQTTPPFAPAKTTPATKTPPPPPEPKPVSPPTPPPTTTTSGTQPPKPEEKKEGKSKGVLVLLVLLLLLGAGGFAAYKFLRPSSSKPCNLVVKATEGSHEVLIDGQSSSQSTTATITYPGTEARKKVKVSLRLQNDYEVRSGGLEKTADLISGKDVTVTFDVAKKVTAVGRVTITSEPTGATVYLDGRQQGVTTRTLETGIGPHEVVVEKSGYQAKTNRVTIKPDQTEPLHFLLEASVVELTISSDPRGAHLKVNGTSFEQTTPFTFKVTPTKLEIEVSYPGYKSGTTNINLKPGVPPTLVDFGKLEEIVTKPVTPSKGQVVVKSPPPGATIWVDGQNYGSPAKPLELPPGDHEIIAKAPGHVPETNRMSIKAGQTFVLPLDKLKPAPVAVTIVSDPEGARLAVNSKKTKEKTPTNLMLEPGTYTFTASQDGYEDASERIEISPNSSAQTVKLALVKKGEPVKPPEVGVGTVFVSTDPIGANILVDGMSELRRTPTTIALSSGKHTIMVNLNGYRSQKKEVIVLANATIECVFGALEREGVAAATTLTASIDSEPVRGARIFLDGKDTGQQTPAQVSIKPGVAYELMLQANGYKPYVAKLQVQPGGAHEFIYTLESASVPDKPASIVVSSTPREAQIWTNGVNTSRTTVDKISNVAPGVPYVVTVKLDGYEDAEEKLVLKPGEEKIILKDLIKKGVVSTTVDLEVKCNPSGADIYVDGQKMAQVTPATLPLSAGRHKIKVIRIGFGEGEKEITLESGKPQLLDFGVLSSGLVDVRVETTPPGAKIVILEGLNRVASGEAGSNFSLKPDLSYSIQATMDGYEYDQKTILPKAGIQNIVRLALKPKPATLLVTSSPTVATIYLDGQKVGRITTADGLSFPVTAGEKHRVEAEFTTGEKRKFKEFIPQPGETVREHFNYK